jgi:hypothetical protein
MRKFRKIFLMIGFLVHLIIAPYKFQACLMPLRPLFNQSRIPPKSHITTFFSVLTGVKITPFQIFDMIQQKKHGKIRIF